MNPIQKEYFSKYLVYLTEGLKLSAQGVNAISLQALDALNYILQNKNQPEFVKFLINEIFVAIIGLITETQITELWDLIDDLFKDYFVSFADKGNILRNLIAKLRDRIFLELSKIKGEKMETNIFINKSWNIIRSAAENVGFEAAFVEIMESELYPLFEMLKDPSSIDFDEDILLLIAELMKKSQRVTAIEFSLVKYLGLYFEKYHCVFGNLFATLNCFVYFGKEFFALDNQSLNLVLQIGIQALFVNNQFSNEANQGQGALIIQSVIQNQAGILTEEQKVTIIQKTIERGCQNIQKDFLRCQLNEIFLSFFVVDYEWIFGCLLNNGKLESVIQGIIDKTFIFKHKYDRKLFVFGITRLFSENITRFSFAKLAQLVVSLIRVLRLEKSKREKLPKPLPIKRRETNNKTEICEEEEEEKNSPRSEEGSMGSSENLDSDEDGDCSFTDMDMDFDEESEINTTLNTLKSSLIREDEYEYFRQAFNKVKMENLTILQSLVTALPVEDRHELNEILLCQKVGNEQTNGVHRKIVKVKH